MNETDKKYCDAIDLIESTLVILKIANNLLDENISRAEESQWTKWTCDDVEQLLERIAHKRKTK